ncbi:MAG: translocation/assembly module TamB domain-containing protein [Gammaproteobacteria bacterium]|nr:translocation/assembly module TamB domain-containing protein [Gammaproteobacteria bacterium]
MIGSKLRIAIIALASLIISLIAAVAWLAMTESGLATTVSLLQKAMPNLTIETTHGRLYDGAGFSGIHYQIDPENSVEIAQLDLKWQAQQLVYGRLMLDSLRINDIALRLTPDDAANSQAKPIVLPDIALPIAIHIAHLQVLNLSLQHNSQPQQQVISELVSDVAISGNRLKLKKFTVTKHDQVSFNVVGEVHLTGNYQTSLDYQWHYLQAGSIDAAAHGTIKGNVAEMTIEQDLTRPVQGHQQLLVRQLLDQLKWQLAISADNIKLADIDKTQQGELNTLVIQASGDLNQAEVELTSQFVYPDLPELTIHNRSSSIDFSNWLTDLTVQVKEQPSVFRLNGNLNDVIDKLHVSLSGEWQQLVWPLIGSEPTITSQQGHFMLTGELDDYQVELTTELTSQQQLINVELIAQGGSNQVNLQHLKLSGLGGTANLSGSASWQTLPVQFDLNSVWATITVPESLTSHALSSPKGTLAITGTADNYYVSSTTDLQLNSQPVTVALNGQGTTTELTEFTLHSTLGEGRADFKGKLAWQQSVSLLGKLRFQQLNPQFIAAQWPGELAGTGQIDFSQSDQGKSTLGISNLRITGELRQRPLTLDADLHYADGNLDVSQLEVKSGQSLLTMAGELSDKMTFQWQIKSPDLADFYPELTGQIQAQGNVTGSIATPVIVAKLSGHNVGYAKRVSVKNITSDLYLDLQQQGQMQLKLDVTDLAVDSFKQINSQLTLTGNNKQHQLSLDINNNEIKLEATAAGSYQHQTWQGQIANLQLNSSKAGQWTMTESAPVMLTEQTQQIGRHCLESGQSRVCIAARYDGSDQLWHSQGQLTQIPMTLLHAFSIELEQVTGNINGHYTLTGKGMYPTNGHGQFSVDEGLIKGIGDAIGSQSDITLKQAKVSYVMTADSTTAKLLIEPDVEGTSPITGEITLASMVDLIERPEQASLAGKLTTQVDDLTAFTSLNPAYNNLKGQLKLDVSLAGTVAKPLFSGDIELGNASVELPGLGIILTELQANAQLKDDVVFDYHATSGEGVLSGQGTLVFDQKGWQLNTSLKGTDVELVNLPEAYVIASPDLSFDITAKQASVSGKVVIPAAELAPAQFNTTITPSDDVVIINDVAVEQKSAFPTKVDVAVLLGDKVFVTGVGFKARLTGDLDISGITTDVLLGNGEIIIKDGGYIAYGQKLVIDDGKVMFAGGAVDNPNLDIKAVRKGGNFSAGLRVQGSANDPQIALFSEPAMEQGNILAHLILGRPLAQASVTDAALLATAATGLGLSGGGQISDQISSTFGLDTLAISGNGGGDTALQVGKYLSPKLYLGYGIGIFEPVSTVTLRYKLSKIWSLKAESGVETGVDFLYTYERKNN